MIIKYNKLTVIFISPFYLLEFFQLLGKYRPMSFLQITPEEDKLLIIEVRGGLCNFPAHSVHVVH